MNLRTTIVGFCLSVLITVADPTPIPVIPDGLPAQLPIGSREIVLNYLKPQVSKVWGAINVVIDDFTAPQIWWTRTIKVNGEAEADEAALTLMRECADYILTYPDESMKTNVFSVGIIFEGNDPGAHYIPYHSAVEYSLTQVDGKWIAPPEAYALPEPIVRYVELKLPKVVKATSELFWNYSQMKFSSDDPNTRDEIPIEDGRLALYTDITTNGMGVTTLYTASGERQSYSNKDGKPLVPLSFASPSSTELALIEKGRIKSTSVSQILFFKGHPMMKVMVEVSADNKTWRRFGETEITGYGIGAYYDIDSPQKQRFYRALYE